MRLKTLIRLETSARRFAEIVGVLAKYGLADWLSGADYDWLKNLLKSEKGESLHELSTSKRIRLALTDLGPTFIKLGQILSSRPDLVGPELTAELSLLQSQTDPDSYETVAARIEADLGSPPEQLFASFETEATASGSIGQVHRATLPDGTPVVVKVRHAGIENRITRDLDLLVGLAELAEDHSAPLQRFQPLATARHFQRTLLRELDFTYERRHIERFAASFEDDPTVRFPSVFPDYCSDRILTMDLLDGIAVSDLASLGRAGADLDLFARRGANLYLEMVFAHGFYHADPHPGNLLRLPGDVVGVLDCGMVGHLDESLREDIESMLLAAVNNDAVGLADAIVQVGQVPPEFDEDELRAEVSLILSEYLGQSVAEFDVGAALQRLFEMIREFRIVLPPGFAMLVKTLIILEGTARALSPGFSLASMIQPYYLRAVRRRYAPGRVAAEVGRGYRNWKRLFESLPRDLADILTRFRKGTLEVHMEHRRLESTVDRLVLGLLTSAIFLGSSITWAMEAPPTVQGISVIGGLGFLVSVGMGARLLLAIRRDHRDRE